ncbi:myelin basic protein-like isoform X4 [Gambusia affinis]|uniref:myelin basic protein-like isoform X4 n=1 Tax=Gambusia affinis TaxID=33528 RepID=UPI000F370CE6|nr:myelin basic protein-like isoform X4 [Gambusia affinis]
MAGPVWRAAATDTECLDRSQNQNQARCLRPPRPHRPAPPRQTGRTHPEGAAELGVGSVGSGSEPEPSAADIMATASTSGQSSFGLGKKKKSPGLMDQLSKLFGGEKKKRSKGSFRGHQAASPQQPSARRRTNENAVVHFFRSLVSSPPPKSTASASRTESTKSPVRRRREQSTLSRIFNLGETKSRPPPKRWSTIF